MLNEEINSSNNSNYSPPKNYNPSSPLPSKPVFNPPIIPISQGVVTRSNEEGIAPFEILTEAGSDYFIKLVDVRTQNEILTAYIQGGRPFEVDVPLGTYELKYASGYTWYGPKYLFGPDTVYAKAGETFGFYIQGNQVAGHTVELIMQYNGNLETNKINGEDF